MSKNNYNDWSFMGDNLRETNRNFNTTSEKKDKGVNSFVLLCVWILLLGISLVSLYSVSIPTALQNGYSHYYYLLKQGIAVLIGAGLVIIVCFLPDKVLRILSWPFFLISSVTLFFPLNTEPLCFLSTIMVLSAYYGKKGMSYNKFTKNIVPAVVVLISVVILLISMKSISAALLYLVCLALISFAGGSILYFLIFSVVFITPIFLWVFTDPQRIRQFLACFILPSDTLSYADVFDALKAGGIFGVGLGNGTFKSMMTLPGNQYILVNAGEETGFTGLAFIMILFAFLGFLGIQSSLKIGKTRPFAGNTALGCTLILILSALINLCSLCGFGFQSEIALPMFSFRRMDMIVSILEFGLIYRVSRTVNFEGERKSGILNNDSIKDDFIFPDLNET